MSSSSSKKKQGKLAPNVLICGTPGTGKTSTCERITQENPTFKHFDISALVKANKEQLSLGFDEETQSHILNEDAIVDKLEEHLARGGCIVDTHSMIDYFPQRWFQLVIVLRTDNTILFDRLKRRGYSDEKVRENVDCEIVQVVLDEAMDSYEEEIVKQLVSNSVDDLENNVDMISSWLRENS